MAEYLTGKDPNGNAGKCYNFDNAFLYSVITLKSRTTFSSN